MEPESRKLVGESSTRPTRTRPRSNRTKLVEESPITPRSSKKKNTRKRKATREKFYSLADPGILDQKEEKGRVYYLCNWADDPETGESFPPSWEPYDAVTLDEISNWQSRRWAGRRLEQERQESEDHSGQRGTGDSIQESTQESEDHSRQRRTVDSIQESTQESEEHSSQRGTVDSIQEFAQESEDHNRQRGTVDSIQESTQESEDHNRQRGTVESIQESTQESEDHNRQRGTVESIQESTQESEDHGRQRGTIDSIQESTQESEDHSRQRGTVNSIQESTQESQPPRAAKRRRITHGPDQTTEEQSPAQKSRRVGTVESARFQSVSRESIDQGGLPNEIKDSYEDEQEAPPEAEPRVEIEIHGSFDRDAYLKVVTSSQITSQLTSQVSPASTHFETTTTRHKFSSTIWDEDIEGLIHGSQEQPGSSSYNPSEIASSKPEATSIQDTEVNTRITTSSHGDSSVSWSVDSEFADPLTNFTQASFTASHEVPATPVQTPREKSEDNSPEQTPEDPEGLAKSPFPQLSVVTHRSPSKSQDLPNQKGSLEKRSEESSGSLPSPPFESVGSTAEQFAQITSQNRQPTTPEQAHIPESVGGTYRRGPRDGIDTAIEPSTRFREQSSTPLPSAIIPRSVENLEVNSLKLSPIPIIPAHVAPAVEESKEKLSVRTTVVIDLTMDEAPPNPVNPVLAKLQLRKAEAIAKRAAERAASASRSLTHSPARVSPAPAAAVINYEAVAASQTVPLQKTMEEAVLTAFEPNSSPKASPETETEPEGTPTGLRMLSIGREEYVVPLPMVSYARDVYVNAIRSCRNQRYAFLTDDVFDASLVKDIDSMIEDLDRLCNHQDLIVDDFSTQKLESVERQAKWAENISTKCIFLAEFLALMQTEEKQIAILVRPGRMLEILEALFVWHGFVYNRADQSGYAGNTSGGPMKISLIPTEGNILGFDPPSIVIAFDSTYPSFPYLKELRTNPTFQNKPVPLLSLIVTHSIEHLEKCFDKNLDPIERKIKLVSCLTQIGDGVGKLSSEYHVPPMAAKAVAEYLIHGAREGTWPLLPMPNIEDLDLNIESSQYEQPNEEPSRSAIPSYDVSLSQAAQLGLKRDLEIGGATNRDSPKRQKLTPVPGEKGLSRVSDTVRHTSSEIPISASAEVSEMIAKTDKVDDEQEEQVSMLLKKINDLEIQLRSTEAAESELRQINRDLETRCQDYESSISSIQPKYQEALNDRGRFEHEYNLALLRHRNLKKDIDKKDAELTKLREQKIAADAELGEARAALVSSVIPGVAELGRMKEQLAKERSEKERLQKRLMNMEGELEYMRNSCQNSSKLAAEHASERGALQTEVTELREKAKENMVRIHAIQKSGEIEEYVRRIRELKEENGELEKELERKGEELRTVMNGRRATRGTSVPRSPRMTAGGTMSPVPRPMGRAMQMGGIGMTMGGVVGTGNGGSRGASPMPGELSGFRGTGTLVGEALVQERGIPGGVRWGNHLQQ